MNQMFRTGHVINMSKPFVMTFFKYVQALLWLIPPLGHKTFIVQSTPDDAPTPRASLEGLPYNEYRIKVNCLDSLDYCKLAFPFIKSGHKIINVIHIHQVENECVKFTFINRFAVTGTATGITAPFQPEKQVILGACVAGDIPHRFKT